MSPQSVKCLMHSQQLPHVSCGAGALIKGCLSPVLVVKGRLHKALSPISARQLYYMCMPMRPNKAETETAVHGCHDLGKEPIPAWVIWLCVCQTVGWCLNVSLAFALRKGYPSCRLCQMCVNSYNKNRMTHPLRVAKNCTTHPLSRFQKLMTHPLSALPPPPPPILFDQSLRWLKIVFARTLADAFQRILKECRKHTVD